MASNDNGSNHFTNIFQWQKAPRDVTGYMLSRGVADYSDLYQFNNYETGYGFLIVLKIPDFLQKLCLENDQYASLIKSYRHILEYDFKNLDGIEDITSDPSELQDGINNLNVITKVNEQSASQFSMRYYERSGSIITKVHELFLRGIKDPRTQVKRYMGLLKPGVISGKIKSSAIQEAGYEHETFQFLYFNTDNTAREIEKAYLLVSCQPTTAETSMYSFTKGDIAWREVTCTFNGYPITGRAVSKKAQEFLDWINERTVFEESRFGYKALNEMRDADNDASHSGNNIDSYVHPKSAIADGYGNKFYDGQ